MANNNQIKAANIAKDFTLKPSGTALKQKDLTDIFTAAGLELKPQAGMDTFSLDFMWETITKANQIVNIEDYIDGITYVPSDVKKKPAEPAPAPAEPAKQPAAETAPAVKPAEAGKAPEAAKAPVAANSEAKPAEASKTANAAPVNGQPKQDKSAEKNITRSAGERFESRMKSATAITKDAKPAQKEAQKQQPKKHGIEVRERTGGSDDATLTVSAPKANTRVVDTRGTGSNVDLSKYDDKLDNFVPDDIQDAKDTGFKVKKPVAGEGAEEQRNKTASPRQAQQQRGGKPAPQPSKDKDNRQQNNRNNNQNRNNQQQNNQGKKGQPQKGDRRDKRNQPAPAPVPVKKMPVKATIPDEITVGEFAQRIKVSAGEVVKRLMLMGMMVSVNQTIDFDTAFLIADELGAEVTKEVTVSIEEKLFEENTEADSDENLKVRPPVVCVMGHVDHGKTSLLDAIRNTHVTTGEAGGITQHIGAYKVRINGKDITFLDTPGHEAFTAMRARGAQATDIAILVVAADDGIMPQTVEAINHAKAAGVEIIVAINKMDKPTANPDNIKQELTKYELVPEEWGGDVMCIPVSAIKHTGIDDLLESVLLIAEVKEYKANPDRRAKGIIIESKLDKGRGPVATVLIQNGTLHPGDIVIAGTCVGRVRAMTDHTGRTVKVAPPSTPVEITGLDDVPQAGDEFNAVADEKMARELADNRRAKAKEDTFKANSRTSLNDLFTQIQEGVKDLNVIVKADVGGSAEAVKQSLEKLSNDEVRVHVIHAAAGGITEGDVMFAAASQAIIVGFNVRPDHAAIESAERQGVDVRTYRVIYECIDEITAAMKGMLAPKFKETLLGHAEVRQLIHIPNVGFIAGSYVQDGKITRQSQIRIVRDGIVVYEDKISSLRRFKDDVKEVASGYECGIGLDKYNDLKAGDILEAFIMEQVEQA